MFNDTFDFVLSNSMNNLEPNEKLKFLNKYTCKKYTHGRPITDVKPSTFSSNIFLASYGVSDSISYTEPDGYVLVWNTTMNNQPEFIFISQPAVCTALFDKYNPHLIIGGTYTGNIVLWDIRAKQKPVQKTLFSGQSHKYPVYCADVIGTQNAHNLVTLDIDGRLCNWSLNMLTNPSYVIDLKKGNKEISCTSFSFQEGEIDTFYGGTDEGILFQAQIHGNKAGITHDHSIHNGPITSTHFHPLIDKTADHNDLILTCSVDWSCKLLSIKKPNNILYTFDSFEDYLTDVKWHPTHPGIFAASSSNGKIRLCNLSTDIDLSFFETTLINTAINKMAWSCDGKKLIAGDADGTLTLWHASSDVYQPRADDIAKFDSKIGK
uniref:Cytoplasmic dynein intermediate chain n=1 Tax=Piliocolobus tephrosceles TaxID=591936 RepID=A0A8C9GLE1_9PRIM